MKKEKLKKVKKPLKKEKTLTNEVKKEKWYINFKKKLLEDQKELSKKHVRDRNLTAVAAFVCFLLVFLATSFLDYSRAYYTNEYVYKGLSYFTCDLGFVCRSDEISRIVPADDVSEAFLMRPEDIGRSEIGFPSMARILGIYLSLKHK